MIYSTLGAQQTEVLMKSVAEEIEEVALQRGRFEAQVQTRAEDILKILAVRGLQVSSKARQRILACRDLPTLDQWFVRAVQATSVSEVFDELPQ